MSVTRPDVRLVPLSLEHAPAMFRWMEDPEVRLGVGIRATPSLERTQGWIAQALERGSGMFPFAILEGDAHVGNVVLDRLDSHLSTVRLSIYVGESSCRGRGVGQAAVRLALAHAFEQLGLYKVWLTVHAENEAARRMYTVLGFQEEGRLRGEFLLAGRRVEAIYMGVLASEFHARNPRGGEELSP
ncbi:GNAT family N-acetyltransferase [Corallococcus terminator]